MKAVVLSESAADEAALRILAEAVLGRPVEWGEPRRRRHRGLEATLAVLPAVLKELHYRRSADHLIVVVDSNKSPLHAGDLAKECMHADTTPACRLCELRRTVRDTMARVMPMASRLPVRAAVGIAVPALEAWYLCGKDPHATEAEWERGMRNGAPPFTKAALKTRVYGTDRPSLELEVRRGEEEMRRVVKDLDLIERSFPTGFGAFRADLRGWLQH